MPTISFSPQETQVLVSLLDVAVKATGLQTAESAVVLLRKIQAAEVAERELAAKLAEQAVEKPKPAAPAGNKNKPRPANANVVGD